MLTLDDLMPWCSKENTRPYIQKPFVRDGKTYATNGWVLIELNASLEGADGEGVDAGHALSKAFFEGLQAASLRTVEQKIDGECPVCEGTGHEHPDCPDCCCDCEECDGSGKVPVQTYAALRGGYFNSTYTNLLAQLPGLKLPKALPPDELVAVGFTFDGGRGAIMRVSARGMNQNAAVPVEKDTTNA